MKMMLSFMGGQIYYLTYERSHRDLREHSEFQLFIHHYPLYLACDRYMPITVLGMFQTDSQKMSSLLLSLLLNKSTN